MGRVNQVGPGRTVAAKTKSDKPEKKAARAGTPDLAGLRKRLHVSMASKGAQQKGGGGGSMKRLLKAVNVAINEAEQKDVGTVRAKKRRQRRRQRLLNAGPVVVALPLDGKVPIERRMRKFMVNNILYRAGIHRAIPGARGALQQCYQTLMDGIHRRITALWLYHGRGMEISPRTYQDVASVMGLRHYGSGEHLIPSSASKERAKKAAAATATAAASQAEDSAATGTV